MISSTCCLSYTTFSPANASLACEVNQTDLEQSKLLRDIPSTAAVGFLGIPVDNDSVIASSKDCFHD